MIAVVGAVIGVYIMLYQHQKSMNKQLSDANNQMNDQLSNMYTLIHSHIQQAEIHPLAKDFVRKDMCKILHQQAVDSNMVLSAQMAKVQEILQELRDYMIAEKNKEKHNG